MIEIPTMTIVVRAIVVENNKYYLQVFLDECLYKLWIIKMIYYDRIDISKGTDVNKTSASKEWCFQNWCFLNYSFKFQPNVCNRCQDWLISMNLSDIAILNNKGSDYSCIVRLISKNETITLSDRKKRNILK